MLPSLVKLALPPRTDIGGDWHGLVVTHRKGEEVSKYDELLDLIKKYVFDGWWQLKYIGDCANLVDTSRFYKYVKDQLELPDSWVQQAPDRIPGYNHRKAIPGDHLLDLVNAYLSVRSKNARNLESVPEMIKINIALVDYAEHFMPMIDALREAGFVNPDQQQFVIKWRFQSARHAHAAVWHMDGVKYSPYADEDGTQESLWTSTCRRCIVTAGCVNTSNIKGDDDEKPKLHHCGTKVLSGVPVLTQQALENITSAFSDAFKECNDPIATRTKFVNRAFNATTFALTAYLEPNGKFKGKFKDAGIQEFALENGEIATYNDSVFHSADNSTPEGFQRCFFVACPTATNNVNNQPIPFKTHATLKDGTQLMFDSI